jgi:hypothetical protein
MKTKLILLCLIIAICGCGKKTVQNTTFAGKDYSLKFPDTWEINEKGMMGMDLIGLSPLESTDDAFRENINVILENLPKAMADRDYLELTLAGMNKMFGLPSDSKFVPVKVGNENGYHLHYSVQMGQNEIDNDLYIVIKKNSAYVITCSNAKGKRDDFKAIMESVVGTFAIKK